MYPSGVFVEADQNIRAGEIIAEVGSNGNSTGPHLHFEIHTLPAISGGVGTHVTPRLATAPDDPEGPSQSPSETSTPEEPSPEPKESESPDPPSTDPDEPEETDAHLEDGEGDDDEGDVKEERTDEEPVSDAEGTHEAVKVDDDVLDEKGSGEGIDDLEEFTSQSTGYFDPSSFGVLHDPLPFLLELGFGIAAPSVCLGR